MPKQQILTFVSYRRDHAAIWTFMEFTANDPGYISTDFTMQDKEGRWWLCNRGLFNTNEQAERSLAQHNYFMADETVVLLADIPF